MLERVYDDFVLCFRDIIVGTRHNLESSVTGDEDIYMMIHDEVTATIREVIPKMFESIKTTQIETFDECYAIVTEVVAAAPVAAARVGSVRVLQYWYFDNTKPPTFDRVQDPIITFMWLSDVEGCFFTCSCPADQKVRCTLNLLKTGAKDWWRLASSSYSAE